MGAVATFNYTTWVATFPAFAAGPGESVVVNSVLPIATVYWRNDGTGPCTNAAAQLAILNLIVAHCCQLLFGPNGTTPGGGGIVGRISDATEGSVSVSAEFPETPQNAWFLQTTYGAMFWQATAPFRTMRYRAGPRPVFGPLPFNYWVPQ